MYQKDVECILASYKLCMIKFQFMYLKKNVKLLRSLKNKIKKKIEKKINLS